MWSVLSGVAGYPNIFPGQIDKVKQFPLGAIVAAVDPYFGQGEFMYVCFQTNVPFLFGQLVRVAGIGDTCMTVVVAANTANTGRAVAVCITTVTSQPYAQYGWVQISGNAVMKATASVPAGTSFGIDVSTAGSVAAVSAGRQVLNAVSVAPSSTTVVKSWRLTSGKAIATVNDVNGLVPGLALSGTGVSGTILSIDPDQRTITMSANATISGDSSVTATYTGFIIGLINRSFIQGAIT